MIEQFKLKIDTIQKLRERTAIAKTENRDIREMLWELKEAIAGAHNYALACQQIAKCQEGPHCLVVRKCLAVVELARQQGHLQEEVVENKKMIDERISHATTEKTEYYVIRFNDKEFRVKIVDSQRHHKDYPEITKIEVNQIPSREDEQKVRKLIKQYEMAEDKK